MSYLRATRVLCVLLGTALVVSVIHYVDNYVNYADFPTPDPGSSLPAPSKALVGGAWFAFTAFGVLGLVLWFRRRITLSAICLTAYSVSGLIGFGHYLVPGAFHMVWWRQVHVIADICCGAAIAAFALWSAWHSDELSPPGTRL
ncbi:hypothetical protein [Nocardioides montaniterrae]